MLPKRWNSIRQKTSLLPFEYLAMAPLTVQDKENRNAFLQDIIEVFEPNRTSIVLGRFLSGVLIVAGVLVVVLTISAAHLQNPLAPWGVAWTKGRFFSCLLGVALIGGGTALALYCNHLAYLRVEIYSNGFKYVSTRLSAIVLWTEVVAIRESKMGMEQRVSDDPSQLEYDASLYTLVNVDGAEYKINSRDIENIGRFREVLLDRARCFSLPWETSQTPWSYRNWMT